MNIVVLAGGYSPERDVSLSSGCLIANALVENGHNVLLLDLYIGATDISSIESLFINSDSSRKFEFTIPKEEPNLEKLKEEVGTGNILIGRNVIEICYYADLVFLALHGDIGENGKLQALFDIYDIRYTGTSYIGSLLAMDKDLAKQIMRKNGVLTPDWVLYDCNSDSKSEIEGLIGFPCVIKPCSCGSSVGVSIVCDSFELDLAITSAKRYEDTLIIEKMIPGREFSVGILNGVPLPVIEIIPLEGFYDYLNKYQKGLANEVCPANIPVEISNKLQSAAMQVHKSLRLNDYSRIDFILDENDNPYCLEANTLPGMTPTSLLPQQAAAHGISYNELCEKIAKMGLQKK